MDLRDCIRLVARRRRVLVAVLLLGTVIGCLAGRAQTPWYRATATVFVALRSGADSTGPDRTGAYARTRARSYAAIVTSPAVTGPVVRELGLPLTTGRLARRITADTPESGALVRISANDPAPAEAARIANAVAQRFAAVIEDLERPAAGRPAPVRLTVAIPASVPTAPRMTRFLQDVVIGLVAGAVLGLLLVRLLDGSDGVLRTAEALAAELSLIDGPPLLGAIPKDGRVTRHPVAAVADPHSARAEGFRELRTSLHVLASGHAPKVLAVTSAFPGEGRTSTAVNLTAALAETGAAVCLVDADLRRARVADTLGLIHDTGLTTVLTGQAGLDEVLQHLDTFTVLTSGPLPSDPAELLGAEVTRHTLRELAGRFDHVVIDTGTVLPVADAAVLAPAVDAYLLVVRAHRTTRRELARTVRVLKYTGTRLTGAVLNRAPARGKVGPCRRQPTAAPLPSPRQPVLPPPKHLCAATAHPTAPKSTTESATP